MNNPDKVTKVQADAIHSLLTDAMELSLRQMLQTGEINPAMIGKVIDYLKYNKIEVVPATNAPLSSLAELVAAIDLDNL
jgi:hypothetical protein